MYVLGRRAVMKTKGCSDYLHVHFVFCYQYPTVFQKGSKAAFLYYLILVKKSGRIFVPHPNWSSFLIPTGSTSTGRISDSLIRKIHPGAWKQLQLLQLGHWKPLLLERPLSMAKVHCDEVLLVWESCCSASWC